MNAEPIPDEAVSQALVEDRVAALWERVERAGRDVSDVTLVAVTKGFPPWIVDVAQRAGLVDLGENYAQELVAKVAEYESSREAASEPVTARAGIRWHFIGRLQRNKVRSIAPHVWLWQTVDRVSLADEIARRALGARVMIQVNTTGEAHKGGCPLSEVEMLVEHAVLGGLTVDGLMTVGPAGDPESARPGFRAVAQLTDSLGLAECSMGMSADLDVALSEGATMVRVGTALFGPRRVAQA